jgi:hypothetical protein
MTSISHVEHRNGTCAAQDSVLADEGGAFAFDIEVDVNKVDLETSGTIGDQFFHQEALLIKRLVSQVLTI